ncbi:MAG: hypothetical protein RL063_1902 [Pseudomonadota bacterium]
MYPSVRNCLIAVASLVTMSVQAANNVDMAVVTQVNPRYESVNMPRQQCQTYQETVPQERSLVGPIIGGVAGAIIGSQVGGGKGRIATGALGAGVGAIVGDRIDNNNSGTNTRQVERCSQVDNYQQIVRDYDVTYQYQNRTYKTIMQNYVKPGDAIRVRVEVTPY